MEQNEIYKTVDKLPLINKSESSKKKRRSVSHFSQNMQL
jgi:hypothetical protein